MVLDFEYGINTGNRFLDFVDHDEDPEEFIAGQTKTEDKTKKTTKDTKLGTSSSTKKATSKTTTTTTPAAAGTTTRTTNVSSSTTKTNKENLTGKSTSTDQRKQQSTAFSDNNNQQTRPDSGRGGGRGFPRRGGSAGQDRPAYEGGNRGDGQQRSQRFNKFDATQTTNETSGFEQGGEAWSNEAGNDNQSFGGYRGRGRGGPRRGNYEGGRGNYEGGRGNYRGGRGNYEGGRGNYEGGRGGSRGRGGRGNFGNRNFEEGSQQQQTPQDNSGWKQNTESNFDNTNAQPTGTGGQEVDPNVSSQDQPFEPDQNRRGNRGHVRGRTFHNNRNYGSDRSNQYEQEGGEGGNREDYRHNRRQYDRQPRTNLSGVKPIEKKDGEGAHNWGNPTENPEENPVSDDITEGTGQASNVPKDWSQQVDEAEKQMTLDEYKRQLGEKKKAHLEKLPQFNTRTAGEGEDPKNWKEPEHVYRKKNDDDETEEGESGAEESGGEEEEVEEEQTTGKKKIISIPLRFKPIEIPRGPAGSRGGPRRGGGSARPYRERPNREDQPRPNSPNQQQQQPPFVQQTGENQNDEQQQHQQQPYHRDGPRGGSRGGPRQGSGRGDYRRPYGNSNRGSRGGYNRTGVDPNAPNLDNTDDFPTLPKQ